MSEELVDQLAKARERREFTLAEEPLMMLAHEFLPHVAAQIGLDWDEVKVYAAAQAESLWTNRVDEEEVEE